MFGALTILVKIQILTVFLFSFVSGETYGDTASYIQKYGYPVELHHVTTQDGYILALFRIPTGKSNQPPTKGPVLFNHGLTSSSADYVAFGPGQSLPYTLADLGYDVWLVNVRGTPFSQNHTTLSSTSYAYWQFSIDEISYYDVPATIDYVLKTTNFNQLQYIGHSQGAVSFYMMANTRPEYNKKIKLMTSLAGVAYLAHPTNFPLKLASAFVEQLQAGAALLQLKDVPGLNVGRYLGKNLCGIEAFQLPCKFILDAGYLDIEEISSDKLTTIFTNYPASASVLQFIQVLQWFKAEVIRKYDYGEVENILKYGTPIPPEYELGKITAPLAMYYSANDAFTSIEDADNMAQNFGNLVLQYLVPNPKFNHLDYLLATDIFPLLYNKVIETIEQYQ